MENITSEVLREIRRRLFIKAEASGRHVHLSREDGERLFGKGFELSFVKALSQPGQFVSRERVSLITPKGRIDNVAVLGPFRKDTQVELSLTDARVLGMKLPVKQSGEVEGTPGITIEGGGNTVTIERGVMAAKRHIHITPADAERLRVCDNESVKVKLFGTRPLIFDDTVVRVSDKFSTVIHLDYDEANACGMAGEAWGMIVK